jgi:hypothetical protein
MGKKRSSRLWEKKERKKEKPKKQETDREKRDRSQTTDYFIFEPPGSIQ